MDLCLRRRRRRSRRNHADNHHNHEDPCQFRSSGIPLISAGFRIHSGQGGTHRVFHRGRYAGGRRFADTCTGRRSGSGRAEIGAVGVTGDTSDNDEATAFAGLEAANLI